MEIRNLYINDKRGDDLSGDGSVEWPFETVEEAKKYANFNRVYPCILRCDEYFMGMFDGNGKFRTQI